MKPHEANGRPIDEVDRSWWDAGFRVVGYPPPPMRNFKRYIKQLRQAIDPRRRRRLLRRASREKQP